MFRNISKKPSYDGYWLNGMPHGQGVKYYENGIINQIGYWKEGKLEGYGKRFYDNGSIMYIGLWKDGLWHGEGKRFYPSSNQIQKSEGTESSNN